MSLKSIGLFVTALLFASAIPSASPSESELEKLEVSMEQVTPDIGFRVSRWEFLPNQEVQVDFTVSSEFAKIYPNVVLTPGTVTVRENKGTFRFAPKPGKNEFQLHAVTNRGETKSWKLTLTAPSGWLLASSCRLYDAGWETPEGHTLQKKN